MKAIRGLVGLVVVLVPLLVPRGVEAACDFVQTAPDGRVRVFPGISSATNDLAVFFLGRAGRSYSVEAWISSKPYGVGVLSPNLNTTNCPITDMAGLTNTAANDPAPQGSFPSLFYRVSVTPAASSVIQLRVGNTVATAVEISVKVSETTLFSTAWSTGGTTFDTFYSLLNTSSAVCTGTLTLFDTGGTAQTTAVVTIPVAGTASTNTNTLVTPRGLTGTAKFTHNCPPGAILPQAAIANFTSNPFYVQFVPFQSTRE